MAIKIKGVVIETGKLWSEYTDEQKQVLPPLNAKFKSNWRLGYDGNWYHDDYND